MTEVPSPQLRISDQNRESALSALGEHMSAGRIDIDEYGERSARITAAKTRGELSDVFADLPAPHPTYEAAAAQPVAAPEPPARTGPPQNWSPAQRVMAGLLPLFWLGAIALIATGTLGWPIIFVPIGLTAVGKALWGQDWHHNEQDRERRRELRERHRRHHRELGH